MTDLDTLIRLLETRHSCRAFLPDPVPRGDIEAILSAAQKVPSWCNAQPWQLDITSGTRTDDLRQRLCLALTETSPQPDFPFPVAYSGAYRDRRRACGFQLYDAVGIARDDHPARTAQSRRNFEFFDAPHFALITTDADLGPYGAVDCGGYITAFCLAATALGVASIPQAAVAPFAATLRSFFGLDDSRKVVCGISFGYADQGHPANAFRTRRAPLTEVVRWHEDA